MSLDPAPLAALQLTDEVCRRCDEPYYRHYGVEHFCPMYCTFQGRATGTAAPSLSQKDLAWLERWLKRAATNADTLRRILAALERGRPLPETRTDTERLDWLEARVRDDCDQLAIMDGAVEGVCIQVVDCITEVSGRTATHGGKNLREAIDAARVPPNSQEGQ